MEIQIGDTVKYLLSSSKFKTHGRTYIVRDVYENMFTFVDDTNELMVEDISSAAWKVVESASKELPLLEQIKYAEKLVKEGTAYWNGCFRKVNSFEILTEVSDSDAAGIQDYFNTHGFAVVVKLDTYYSVAAEEIWKERDTCIRIQLESGQYAEIHNHCIKLPSNQHYLTTKDLFMINQAKSKCE